MVLWPCHGLASTNSGHTGPLAPCPLPLTGWGDFFMRDRRRSPLLAAERA